jgi:hypothetical protein
MSHLGDAAVRDRAQTAAHDEALRTELRRLPTAEIVAGEMALDGPLAKESRLREMHAEQRRHLESAEARRDSAVRNLERVEALGRRERRRELPRAQERVESCREVLERMQSRVEGLEPLRGDAGRESAAIRQILAEHSEQMLTAARTSPSPYILKELGERPTDPTKAKAWDRGVKTIEGYRSEHGITDKSHALGREPPSRSQQRAARPRKGACASLSSVLAGSASSRRSAGSPGASSGDSVSAGKASDPRRLKRALAPLNPLRGYGRCAP